MAEKAKNMFIGQFGLAAWDQVQREVISIRKEIERQKYEEERLAEARLEDIKEAGIVTAIVLFVLSIMLGIGIILLRS